MYNDETDILNIKELSKWIHISQSMLRKLIYQNAIPFWKIGNRYYFKREIISKWILTKHNDIDIGGFGNDI